MHGLLGTLVKELRFDAARRETIGMPISKKYREKSVERVRA
jgi:hypothetical protein